MTALVLSLSCFRLVRVFPTFTKNYPLLKPFFHCLKMENVQDVKFEPLKDSIYLKPLRMVYKQVCLILCYWRLLVRYLFL